MDYIDQNWPKTCNIIYIYIYIYINLKYIILNIFIQSILKKSHDFNFFIYFLFLIIYNRKCFQFIILKWFLKTGLKKVTIIFQNISHYCFIDQINAVLVRIKDFFQKCQKNIKKWKQILTSPNFWCKKKCISERKCNLFNIYPSFYQ